MQMLFQLIFICVRISGYLIVYFSFNYLRKVIKEAKFLKKTANFISFLRLFLIGLVVVLFFILIPACYGIDMGSGLFALLLLIFLGLAKTFSSNNEEVY